jgi:glycosyl transferase family 25
MNWTLVTSYFNLSYHLEGRTDEWYLSKSKFTLSIKSNMVIYCDEKHYEGVKKIRDEFMNELQFKTEYIIGSYMKFRTFNHFLRVSQLAAHKINEKDNPEYMLLQCSKWEMVENVINTNPFGSTHFGWVDFGYGYIRDLSPTVLDPILGANRNKFSIMYIHYRTRPEIEIAIKNHTWLCTVAGGFWTANEFHMRKAILLFKSYFEALLRLGGFSNEDHYMGIVCNMHPEIFDLYYGDYQHIFVNYLTMTEHHDRSKELYYDNAIKAGDKIAATKCLEKITRHSSTENSLCVMKESNPEVDRCISLRISEEYLYALDESKRVLDNGNVDIDDQIKLLENIDICAAKCGRNDDVLWASDSLMMSKDVPSEVKEGIRKSILQSMDLKGNISSEIINLDFDIKSGYHTLNPSIIKVPFDSPIKYIYSVRAVNYVRDKDRFVYSDKCLITVNYLLHLDEKLNIISSHEVISTYQKFDCPYMGIEDIRLISFTSNETVLFQCTCTDITSSGNIYICFGEMNLDGEVIKIKHIQGPVEGRVEKNWISWTQGDKLFSIYSFNPFTILDVNVRTGTVSTHRKIALNGDFSEWRGSSNVIPYSINDIDGYLFLVHEVVNNGYLQYTQRYVWMDSEFNVKHYSHPFKLFGTAVELVMGLTINSENQVILSVGVEDREIGLCVFNNDTVIKSLMVDRYQIRQVNVIPSPPIPYHPVKGMDKIRKVIYINLEKRPDRRDQFLKEMERIGINDDKLIRVDGFLELAVGFGVTISHCIALQECLRSESKTGSDDDYFMILEDDFTSRANDPKQFNEWMDDIFTRIPGFDVFMLIGDISEKKDIPIAGISDVKYTRVLSAQCAAGYIIRKSYVETLRNHLLGALGPLKTTGEHWNYTVDQWWKKIQCEGKWYSSYLNMAYMKDSYSDNSSMTYGNVVFGYKQKIIIENNELTDRVWKD